MPLAYWCVLIAALMPIALAAYAKAGSRDNHHPRDAVASMPDAKRRAYAAHENAYENFPFFAVAVITATTLGASISTVNILAALYIVAAWRARRALHQRRGLGALARVYRGTLAQHRDLRATGVQVTPAGRHCELRSRSNPAARRQAREINARSSPRPP